jgi:hypothetical protein
MRKMQEIQPEIKAIQDRYSKLKMGDPERQKMNTEMMALYRDRRELVGGMVLVARIGVAIFLLVSVVNLVGLVVQVTGPAGTGAPLTIPIGIAGIAVTTGMGVAALLISALFGRYSAAWDTRLAESDRVGKILTQVLRQE